MELNLSVEAIARNYRISEEDVITIAHENNIVVEAGRLDMQNGVRLLTVLDAMPDRLNDLRAREHLRRVVGQSAIVFDTCAVMNPSFPLLWERLHPLLTAKGSSVIIPESVVHELENNFIRQPDKRMLLRSIFALLTAGEKDGTVQTTHNEGEFFGDREIIYLANRLRADGDVLVITNDSKLSEDLLNQNRLGCMVGHNVFVNRISFYGYFAKYRPQQSAC